MVLTLPMAALVAFAFSRVSEAPLILGMIAVTLAALAAMGIIYSIVRRFLG